MALIMAENCPSYLRNPSLDPRQRLNSCSRLNTFTRRHFLYIKHNADLFCVCMHMLLTHLDHQSPYTQCLSFGGGPFVMWKYYSVSLPFVLQWEGACRVQPRDSRHRLLLNHSQGFHRRWIRASSSHAVQGIGKMWPLRFLVVVQSTVAIPLVKIPNIYTKWPNSRSLWMPSCSYIMHCAIMD